MKIFTDLESGRLIIEYRLSSTDVKFEPGELNRGAALMVIRAALRARIKHCEAELQQILAQEDCVVGQCEIFSNTLHKRFSLVAHSNMNNAYEFFKSTQEWDTVRFINLGCPTLEQILKAVHYYALQNGDMKGLDLAYNAISECLTICNK